MLIKALCQGSAQEQHDAIETHFTPDAEFQHPLCRVPSLSWNLSALLSGGEINSRQLIMAIFRWYRLLSPKIDFTIHSTSKCFPVLFPIKTGECMPQDKID